MLGFKIALAMHRKKTPFDILEAVLAAAENQKEDIQKMNDMKSLAHTKYPRYAGAGS